MNQMRGTQFGDLGIERGQWETLSDRAVAEHLVRNAIAVRETVFSLFILRGLDWRQPPTEEDPTQVHDLYERAVPHLTEIELLADECNRRNKQLGSPAVIIEHMLRLTRERYLDWRKYDAWNGALSWLRTSIYTRGSHTVGSDVTKQSRLCEIENAAQ